MRIHRTAPLLLAGFGMLTGLIAISGIGALEQARDTYKHVSGLNERYRRADRKLNSVASSIYVVGVLTRDYLLEPSGTHSAEYRAQLVAERTDMEKNFRDLKELIRTEDTPRLGALQKEVEGYWDALDPLFGWSATEKARRSWTFLRQEVIPRRRAALAIADEIASLTQANFEQQKREVDRKQESMAAFIQRMLWITVLLGAGVATATILQLFRLERQSREAQERTQKAEEELRRLSRQLLQEIEKERKSLSRELHDEVGQMLTGLRIELRTLHELRRGPDAEFSVHFESAKNLAEQSLRALRDLAMGLRPSMLDDLGLGSAIQWQARQFSKITGIPVNVDISDMPTALPEPHRTGIYRVVQEALTNSARHARANMIQISIDSTDAGLLLTVRDDGVGFNPSHTQERGLGLIGMEERVNELGGHLTIESDDRNGTTLRAAIPVAAEMELYGDSSTLSR